MWTKLKEKVKTIKVGAKAVASAIVGVVTATALTTQGVYASGNNGLSNIANSFSSVFQDIYKEIIGISTVIACVLIAFCLLLRMISKNPRAIEEATSWIKRIAITWLILMLLSLFVNFFQDIVTDSNADTATPWS